MFCSWLTNWLINFLQTVFFSPGTFPEAVRHVPELWTTMSRSIFSVLWALRKCSWHARDSPSMLDPSPITKFLKLRACSIKIKGPKPSNRARAAIATHNNSISTVRKTQNKHWFIYGFKLLAVHGTGAVGFVAPLPCTAYSSKLAILFDCSKRIGLVKSKFESQLAS